MPTIKKLTLRVERLQVAEGAVAYGKVVRMSADVAPMLRAIIGHEPHEVFCLVALDAKNKVLGYHEVARGGTASCSVEPAATFRAAILANAVGVILAHNHPSGDCTPSPEDVSMTKRLVDVGRMIGIRVVDHIIVGDESHFSFLDAGMLTQVQS